MAVQKIWDGSQWIQVGVSPSEHESDINSVSSQLAQKANTSDLETTATQLAQLMNDWDFGLITSSPTSADDFGSIV